MRRWGSGFRVGRAVISVGLVAGIGVLLATFGPSTAARADDPPLLSESFESTTAELPTGWVLSEFTSGVSQASVVTAAGSDVAGDGTHYLEITSPKDNHARVKLSQTVAADTTYQFHALVRASGTKSGAAAAVLGIDDQTTTSDSITSHDWTDVDLYVRTGAQTTVTFTLGLGNFGQVNHGRADFDAISIAPVATTPTSATVVTLPGAAGAAPPAAALGETMRLPLPNPVVYPMAGVLVLLIVGAGIYLARRPEESVGQS